jgi:cell division septation protein DedD
MAYDYSFDKKTVLLILAGCISVGVLLFVAGLIIGFDRGASQARVQLGKDIPAKEMKVEVPKPKEAVAAPAKEAAPAAPSAKQEAGEAKAAPPEKSAPQPAAQPVPAAAPAADAGNEFSVQLGAFESAENALKLCDKVKARGYAAFVLDVQDSAGRQWHAVRMGHFKKLETAARAAVAFTGKEKIPAFVRPGNEL